MNSWGPDTLDRRAESVEFMGWKALGAEIILDDSSPCF
jgi:hypothetical protein